MVSVALDAARRARTLADINTLSDAAHRTLVVANRPPAADEDPNNAGSLERDLIFADTAGIIDLPRDDAAVATRMARRVGIRVS